MSCQLLRHACVKRFLSALDDCAAADGHSCLPYKTGSLVTCPIGRWLPLCRDPRAVMQA